ncbi:MAG: hypothetical protein WA775_06780 [Psychroserpens sp.]|uniref:hypothetical protein n=1 Tax=Psychroserpens sp. TaxID=2020870 RepID=UPI003C706BB1
MKKLIFVLSLLFLVNCENDDNLNNCNFLFDVGVNVSLNLNLPEYSQLMFSLSSVYIPNQGNAGIYVTNTGNDNYVAWDAADPSHAPAACSFMQRDGINVTCGCDDGNSYELVTGASVSDSPVPCRLQQYRATLSGSNLIISN